MKDIELKPCPFCGGKAQMMPYHYGGLFDEMFWVTCEDCEAEIPSYQTEEEAAKAWNRRESATDENVGYKTIAGYDIQQLSFFARACQEARIKVEDLSELFGNISTAVETVSRFFNEHTERVITEYMNNPIPDKEPVNGFRGAHIKEQDDG